MPEQMTKDELITRLNTLKRYNLAIRMKLKDTQDNISENISNEDIISQLEIMDLSIDDILDIL